MELSNFFVGLDLGQSQDSTAIAVVERRLTKGEFDHVAYAYRKEVGLYLRFLERPPLGTPYPDIVYRVAEVVQSSELAGRCRLVVDATGVGRPVVDMVRKARLGCSLMPVLITGGDTESQPDEYYRVPKRDLVVGLQVLLQDKTLQIAGKLPQGEELVKELMGMQVKLTGSGHDQYGAWREGAHDDLVLAVALACWGANKEYPNAPSGDNGYWRIVNERWF